MLHVYELNSNRYLKMRAENLEGQRFGTLTAIERQGSVDAAAVKQHLFAPATSSMALSYPVVAPDDVPEIGVLSDANCSR